MSKPTLSALTLLLALLVFAAPAGAAFPGENGLVAFVAGNTEEHPYDHILLIRADGTGERALPGSRWDTRPTWSPDGRRLAFFHYETDAATGVYLSNPDGSGRRRLAALPYGYHNLAWSPDGRTIAASNGVTVAMVDVATGSVSHRDVSLSDPDWSPDGTLIAGTPWVDGRDNRLRLIRPDGTIVHDSAQEGFAFEWSPDGRSLATISGAQLVILDPFGSDRRVVAENADDFTRVAWAPDGTAIVFFHRQYQPSYSEYLAVVDLASGEERRLTFGHSPDWQPIVETKKPKKPKDPKKAKKAKKKG